LANILGGVMIFLERPFKIGDIVQIDSLSPMKVVDMTWRSTRLENAFGYHISIPNNDVSNATLTNYSKNLPAGDFITVCLSPDYEPNTIIALINNALDDCGDAILQDLSKGTMFYEIGLIEEKVVAKYWPWWYTADFNKRYGTREKVWIKIIEHLNKAGISVNISSSLHVGNTKHKEAPPFAALEKDTISNDAVE
jgi:small-conductance mechanosensitive channel